MQPHNVEMIQDIKDNYTALQNIKCRKFTSGMQVHLQDLQIRLVSQGHWVKVKVTEAGNFLLDIALSAGVRQGGVVSLVCL